MPNSSLKLVDLSQAGSLGDFERFSRIARANPDLVATLAASAGGVIVIDPGQPELPLVFVNRAAADMTGYAGQRLIGRPLSVLLGASHAPDGDLGGLLQVRRAASSGQPTTVEVRGTRADGSRFWGQLSLTSIDDGEGANELLLGQLADVSAVHESAHERDIRARQQAAVAALGRHALSGADLDALLEEAADILAETLGADYTAICECQAEGQMLRLRGGRGWNQGVVGNTLVEALPGTFAAHVLNTRRPTFVRNAARNRRFKATPLLSEHGVTSSLAVRILGRDRPYGILSAHSTEKREFSPQDADFLDALSHVLGDAVERRQTEDLLRQSRESYDLAVRGANDGLWDWNLIPNRVYYAPRFLHLLGLDAGADGVEAPPDLWFNKVHPEDRARVREALDAHLDGATPYFLIEHRVLHADDSYRWMLARGLAVLDANGEATRIAGSISDINERKRAEHRLVREAFYDSLTGLPNRSLFMDRLTQAIARAKRHNNFLYAVLFLDFDRFKVVNDSLGHAHGDQMLIEIAGRIGTCIRDADSMARLGGDEFAILLTDIADREQAETVARRINDAMARPFFLNGREVVSNASLGIAFGNPDYTDPGEILRDADTAMYQAKGRGRACHVVFEPGMHALAVNQLETETDLRHALERDEFELNFQPVVALHTGRVAGFEALIRWRHPTRGFVMPSEFIQVAEDSGLIVPIGTAVLQAACRQIQAWREQFPQYPDLAMSVNMSPQQFGERDLIQVVQAALAHSGSQGSHLKVEITETAMMENPAEVTVRLGQLKGLGVHLHVDDFGTGYSSLSHLHRFPIDALKVDRSFVTSLGETNDSLEIVRTIVALARNLRLSTVAEGVETEKHLDLLRAIGCDYGQGYLFSRPMTADAASKLLAEDRRW